MPIPIGYKETIITPRVSRSVEAFWSFRANSCGKSLVLPDGRCDIILQSNIRKLDSPIPIITGPATQPYTVDYNVGDQWLGVRLRPDSGVSVWQHKIAQAADAVVLGQDAVALLPELGNINSPDFTLEIVVSALQPMLLRHTHQRLSCAVDALHASGGRIPIAKLATLIGCTTRQLNRLFRSNIGLSTKTYAQLVQFHRTLNLIRVEQQTITSAALEGGYADHAHLTRAFQRFGGFAPSRLPQDLAQPSLFG